MKINIKSNKGFTQHHSYGLYGFKKHKKRICFAESGAGFTLIELLVSIVLLVALGSITTGMIFSTLRGSNKANVNENIRQNGNYALSQISKNIEYAQTFDGVRNSATTYVKGCPGENKTPYEYIKVTPFNSGPLEYNCISTPPTVFTVFNGVDPATSIVDTSSVVLDNCSITCTQTDVMDVPIIGISFALRAISSSDLVETSSPPITFETSVTIRNYKK